MTRWLRRPIVWLPVSGGLLALVAWRSRVWEAADTLGRPDAAPLAAAIGLNAAVALLCGHRLVVRPRRAGRPVAVPPLVPMTVFANTINNLTPGSAGEVLRAWLLRVQHGVPYATGAAVIVIERVVAIGYLGASAAIVFAGHLLGLAGPAIVVLLALVVILPGLVYGAGLRPAGIVARLPLDRIFGQPRWNRAGAALGRMDDTIARLLTRPARLLFFAGTSALVFACYAAQLALVAASVGVALDPVAGWGALGLAIVAGVASLLPFGLGATDLVLAALLGALGVPAPAAAAIAFGNRLVSTLPLGLLGVASYAWLSARLPAGGVSSALAAAGRDLADERPDPAP